MMDIFEDKNIRPMLIGKNDEPFDSDEYIFELKLDGERCIAYLDKNGTELRNKRNLRMLPKFPELSNLHKQVKGKTILDGELLVVVDGKPSFSEIKRRSLMSNAFKIELAGKQRPASFVAFDMLYLDGKTLTSKPLMERKAILAKTVKESEFLALSRYIDAQGVAFYALAEQQELEGIVAKRKDSTYIFDKRTKDWIKIKNFQDDDFVVCGYIAKEIAVVSIVLGQYGSDGELLYKGHVTLGINREDFARIQATETRETSPFVSMPKGNEHATWLSLTLVCTVTYMENTRGGLRQPVFKCLRFDKAPKECSST